MDKIRLGGLRLFCKLGAYPWERFVKREVVINLTLHANLHLGAQSGRIVDTVNYAAVAAKVVRFVEQSEFRLVESLAEGIAAICLEFPKLVRVDVEVEKVHAVAAAERVAVRITREKPAPS